MPSKAIQINDLEITRSSGNPFNFNGILSESILSGIDLDFKVSGERNVASIEELFRCDSVEVYDPFIDRSYTATIRLISSSFQAGSPKRHYRGQVKELDRVPDFSRLELNGQEFVLFRYKGEIIEKDKISHHALLKLNKEEFKIVNKMINQDSIKMRRIGVDEKQIILRFGSGMYWSQHEESGQTYFKYIVRLFPLDLKPSKINLASGNIQATLAGMLISLRLKFESLLEDLLRSDIINEDRKAQLLSESFRESVPQDKIDELVTELYKTQDAEIDFD